MCCEISPYKSWLNAPMKTPPTTNHKTTIITVKISIARAKFFLLGPAELPKLHMSNKIKFTIGIQSSSNITIYCFTLRISDCDCAGL